MENNWNQISGASQLNKVCISRKDFLKKEIGYVLFVLNGLSKIDPGFHTADKTINDYEPCDQFVHFLRHTKPETTLWCPKRDVCM